MNSQEQSEYLLNKAWLWNKLKERKIMLENVGMRDSNANNSISDEELRLFQSICFMILADMEYEEQMLKNPSQNLN